MIAKEKNYAFVSLSDIRTRRNVGACIIEWDQWDIDFFEAHIVIHCNNAGLFPSWKELPNEVRDTIIFRLNEDQREQENIELNRFYTTEELAELGFQKMRI